MAQRYGCLPSKILSSADVVDLYVMDTALAWERYCQEREQAKHTGQAQPAPKLTQQEMLGMVEKVRNLGAE